MNKQDFIKCVDAFSTSADKDGNVIFNQNGLSLLFTSLGLDKELPQTTVPEAHKIMLAIEVELGTDAIRQERDYYAGMTGTLKTFFTSLLYNPEGTVNFLRNKYLKQ